MFCCSLILAGPVAFAGSSSQDFFSDKAGVAYHAGEILLKFREKVEPTRFLSKAEGLTLIREFRILSRLKKKTYVHLKSSRLTTEQLMKLFQDNPWVEAVSPNYQRHPCATIPNDPQFASCWNLHNTGQSGGTAGADIDAVQAWDIGHGDPSVIIGIIDSGIDYQHEDLAGNMWHNPRETPGNGLDDDGNGCVDDYYGISVIGNQNPTGDPMDTNGHGTMCAGVIGAVGNNNLGLAGINWQVKLMALKTNFDDSASISCLEYAIDQKITRGQNIVALNCSWGGEGSPNPVLEDAIEAAGNAGIIVVASAGNNGKNNDTVPFYPASYRLENMIAVAASQRHDELVTRTDASWASNYGFRNVDLAAPGLEIPSTNINHSYTSSFTGTSAAAPHVTGTLGLLAQVYPSDTVTERKKRVLYGVDFLPGLAGKCVTGGRLNIFNALQPEVLDKPCLDSVIPETGLVPDAVITVQGSRFGADPGKLVFTNLSSKETEAFVTNWGSESITARVPAGTGRYIIVRNAAGLTSANYFTGTGWVTLPDPPNGVFSGTAVACQGKIYLFGGLRSGGANQGDALCFDCQTETWTTLASLPTPRSGLAVVELNGKIYCIGGSRGSAFATVEAYDIVTNTWDTNLAPLPTALSYCRGASIGGKIYVTNDNYTYAYDPAANQWTQKASIPEGGRTYHGCVALGGKLYILGGYSLYSYSTLDTVAVYDPGANTWSVLPTRMPLALKYSGVSSDGAAIYVAGGTDKDSAYACAFMKYLPASDAWEYETRSLQELPQVKSSAPLVFVSRKGLYSLTGMSSPGVDTVQYLNFPVLAGDINGDRTVNITDVLLCLQMILGLEEPDWEVADMDRNGVITVSDLFTILKKSLNLW